MRRLCMSWFNSVFLLDWFSIKSSTDSPSSTKRETSSDISTKSCKQVPAGSRLRLGFACVFHWLSNLNAVLWLVIFFTCEKCYTEHWLDVSLFSHVKIQDTVYYSLHLFNRILLIHIINKVIALSVQQLVLHDFWAVFHRSSDIIIAYNRETYRWKSA